MGEKVQKYLHKGSKVLVIGRLVADPKTGGPRVYQRQDGTYGASFIVRASTVKCLDSKNSGSQAHGADDSVPTEDFEDESDIGVPAMTETGIPF